jgi:hypothetical protein
MFRNPAYATRFAASNTMFSRLNKGASTFATSVRSNRKKATAF